MPKLMKQVDNEELRTFAERCTRCMYCLEDEATHSKACPSAAHFSLISYRPFGRLELSRYLTNSSNGESSGLNLEEVTKRIFSCTLCGACEYKCNMLTGKKILDVFKKLRVDLVSCGAAPPEAHKILLKNILEHGTPQGLPANRKLERVIRALDGSEMLTSDAPILYFKGCVASLSDNLPSHIGNMIKILIRSNTNFRVLGMGGLPDEPCCGHVLINTGQEKLAMGHIRRTFETVDSIGVKQVVFTCPACFRAFKYEYPRLLGVKPSFSCITASEFILDLTKRGKLRTGKSSGIRKAIVTYHDPCHLGRHSGIYDAPRMVLKSIDGFQFVELPRNRENAWCCGVGGGVKTGFPALASETGKGLISEALLIGANVVATACPACESGLTDIIKHDRELMGSKVQDIVDIVGETL